MVYTKNMRLDSNFDLLQAVGEHPGDSILWATQGQSLSREFALRFTAQLREKYPQFKRARVLFVMDQPFNACLALLALNGFASALMLTTHEEREARPQVSKNFAPDYVLTDIHELTSDSVSSKEATIPPSFLMLPIESVPATTRTLSLANETKTLWVIPTSGTTAEPKLIAHSSSSLCRTVKRDPRRGSQLRWGLLYGLSRFAGLQVYLQAVAGGSVLVVPPADANLQASLKLFTESNVNALSATPTLWRKFLMYPEFKSLQLQQVTLGGEIADDNVLSNLAKHFPKARIVHIYASTEAGVGFSVTDGKAGFPKTLLQNCKLADVRVRDDGMLLLRPKQSESTSYNGSKASLHDQDGFIETGDLVELHDDRYHFLGRENGVINVGGNKVHPEDVESTIYEVPGIALAKVSARTNPLVGALVQAVVVPQGKRDYEQLQEAILSHCKAKLAPHKVPVAVKVQDSLETTETGKLVRN